MASPNPTNPLPDPGPGRNPPQYPDPEPDTFFSPGMILAMFIAAALVGGGIFWSMSGPSTYTASNPPPTTTGQGGVPLNPPVAPSMNLPPTPPTVAPPIDRTVPPEKIAPLPPTEPRTNN